MNFKTSYLMSLPSEGFHDIKLLNLAKFLMYHEGIISDYNDNHI